MLRSNIKAITNTTSLWVYGLTPLLQALGTVSAATSVMTSLDTLPKLNKLEPIRQVLLEGLRHCVFACRAAYRIKTAFTNYIKLFCSGWPNRLE